MSKEIRIAVAHAIGKEAFAAPVVPVLSDPVDIQKFVESDCGADAWTMRKGRLVALRDNGDGTTSEIKSYEVEEFGGKS